MKKIKSHLCFHWHWYFLGLLVLLFGGMIASQNSSGIGQCDKLMGEGEGKYWCFKLWKKGTISLDKPTPNILRNKLILGKYYTITNNNDEGTFFMPTKTATEWNRFICAAGDGNDDTLVSDPELTNLAPNEIPNCTDYGDFPNTTGRNENILNVDIVIERCDAGLYRAADFCLSVGVGYYSPDNDDNQYFCTNKPSSSAYIGTGNSSSNCSWACNTDYYKNGNSCAAVGTGYYSPNKDNSRYSCTNRPSNSAYTSDGNGSNNCSWACNTDYYKSGNSCVAVGTGYYSPNRNNSRPSCTTKPSNSAYTSDGNGRNNCSWACNTDYYKSGSSCVAVGTGYYSPNRNNSRYSCTTKPSNSAYTSDGNGRNNCSWACNTDYYKSGNSCVAVGIGYYSPNRNNSRSSCTTKPSNSAYTSDGNGSNNCSWACDTDYYKSGSSCVAVGIGYYSPNRNNSRSSCTTKPSNSAYTSDGNGSNNCSWACNTDYYKSGNSCAAVGTGYYSPNLNNSRPSCTNKPSSSAYISDGNGRNNCSWACDTDYYKSGNSCAAVGTGYYSPNLNNSRPSCTNKPSSSAYTSDVNGRNNCSWACDTDYYKSGSSCANVGTGYYSPNLNNSRSSCTTKPSNSAYTSDGNGRNNCSWACDSEYPLKMGNNCFSMACGAGSYRKERISSTNGGACVDNERSIYVNPNNDYSSPFNPLRVCSSVDNEAHCRSQRNCRWLSNFRHISHDCSPVETGYYSPGNNNNRYSCTNKPSNSVYTGNSYSSNNCSWACNSGYTERGNSCVRNATACTNKPANSTYTDNGMSTNNSCYWACNSGYTESGNSCVQNKCGTDYYRPSSSSSCTAVGTGYYSSSNSDSRSSCTNRLSNSAYTSDGNGRNNCGWACDTDYYKNGNSCAVVGTGYYSPNRNNSRYSCSNKPSYSSYTSDGNGSNNCSWVCGEESLPRDGTCISLYCLDKKPSNSTYNNIYSDFCWSCNSGYRKIGNNCVSNDATACTNKPSNSHYTDNGMSTNNSCYWACDSGYREEGDSCVEVFHPFGCFIAGTKVKTPQGLRNIEEIKPGEKIITSGGVEKVMKKYEINFKGKLYAFNGSDNYFVTETHPFMTLEGWKSFDPKGSRKESPGIKVSQLKRGDTLLRKDGSQEKLESFDWKYGETKVYNFGVNGTNDFYADGYWVHNNELMDEHYREEEEGLDSKEPRDGGSGCFIAGTKVKTPQGLRNIEEIKPGEKIITSGGVEKVMKKYEINFKGKLYAFNGSDNYFVTETHPFMTLEGWKSFDPKGSRKESPGIKVSQLKTGDTLLRKDGSQEKLESFDWKYGETKVYNFGVNGTNDFYANGYWVHNVDLTPLFFQSVEAYKPPTDGRREHYNYYDRR